MSTFATVVGLAGAEFTIAATYRNSRKHGPPVRQTTSLSKRSCFLHLGWCSGWCTVLQGDIVILLANSISLALAVGCYS